MASTLRNFVGGTVGNTDGAEVDDYTGSAVTTSIQATVVAGAESADVPVFMRTADNTTITSGDVIITPTGTSAGHAYLAADDGTGDPGAYGTAGAALTLTAPAITGVNAYAGCFHVKFDADLAETPVKDWAIGFEVTGTEVPV